MAKQSRPRFSIWPPARFKRRIFYSRSQNTEVLCSEMRAFPRGELVEPLFSARRGFLELPPGTLKVTFLIETLAGGFSDERNSVRNPRPRRADSMAEDGTRFFPTSKFSATIRTGCSRIVRRSTMKSPWMENYAKLLIKTCHRRGAFAMGGMAAFTPGKTESLRKIQADKVRADKAREARNRARRVLGFASVLHRARPRRISRNRISSM